MKRQFLIAEDEPMIAFLLEDCLDMLGHGTLPVAATYEEAEAVAAQGGYDAAILDINLAGRKSWPIIETIMAKGIPVLIASGGDDLPTHLAHLPVLDKPYSLQELEDAITALF